MSASDPVRIDPEERDGAGDAPARETYATAVSEGFYRRELGGLEGKHDNVRRYWEDQVTRYALREFIEPLVRRKRRALSRIRVLDLGAGAGEGYEILTNLKRGTDSLASKEVDVLAPDVLGLYKGIDLSEAMVAQGSEIYADNPKVRFAVGDLSEGLAVVPGDLPYDLYFSSYGSLSHLRDAEFGKLIADICDGCERACILVADLVGRYSLEWPSYWDESVDGDEMRPYSMSYLFQNGARESVDVPVFPLRYWGGREFDDFLRRIVDDHGLAIRRSRLWDRSVLVGRHMGTGEFNGGPQPVRSAVNALYEFDHRTDLTDLLFDYRPRPRFPELNRFFESFQMAWNAVVYSAIEALDRWDDTEWLRQPPADEYPPAVYDAIRTIRNVIGHVKWFRMGDPRANIVEPQLGYVLRNLEMDMQEGLGAAHSLLAIYEIENPAADGGP